MRGRGQISKQPVKMSPKQPGKPMSPLPKVRGNPVSRSGETLVPLGKRSS